MRQILKLALASLKKQPVRQVQFCKQFLFVHGKEGLRLVKACRIRRPALDRQGARTLIDLSEKELHHWVKSYAPNASKFIIGLFGQGTRKLCAPPSPNGSGALKRKA